MNQHIQLGEHPNSAFTRVVRRRDVSQNDSSTRLDVSQNDLLTNQPLPEIIPNTLSARQIAFREIKKLFCECTSRKKSKICNTKRK